MGMPDDAVVLAVDSPANGIVVVHVAGRLDGRTTARVASLLDSLLRRFAAATGAMTLRPGASPQRPGREGPALIIDLAEVSHLSGRGLDGLRHAHELAGDVGVTLHLAGLTAEAGILAAWAAELLPGFSIFPVLDDALACLARGR
jgi:anti-anti-sigma regulatory factor